MHGDDDPRGKIREDRTGSARESTDPHADEPAWAPDEPVTLPIESVIDLHSFRPSEIASLVEEYLAEASRSGFEEVRIIHGRGIGVQRETVRAVLARSALVVSFRDAPPESGGWGATIVLIRASGDPSRETSR